MENKEKFATFFGEASKGRKLGAIFSWLAAAALLAALFIPAFGIGPVEKSDDENQPSISSEVKDVDAGSSDAKVLVSELEEKSASLVSYLTSYEADITAVTTGEEASSVMGIVLLVVYVVLVIAAVVLALFTMNVLSLVAVAGAVAEALLLYFMSFSGKISDLLLNYGVTSGEPTLNLVMIVVLAAAGVLEIVGVILTYVIHSDNEEEEAFWDDVNDEYRNAETGLFTGSNETAPAQAAAANLVQMNTGKAFAIPEGTELIIGKGSQANIIVSNPIISRAHAKISFHGGVCTIQDLGSKNGTFVGDQKLPNGGSAIVPNGEYITLGNEIFQFNF